jgi:hypothetical protein
MDGEKINFPCTIVWAAYLNHFFFPLQSKSSSISPSPARLADISISNSTRAPYKPVSRTPTSPLRRGQQSPIRRGGFEETNDSDGAAAAARRRADEAARAERRASSSYAATRLPRTAPRPGTSVDAAAAAAASEADVLVPFGRRWLPVS